MLAIFSGSWDSHQYSDGLRAKGQGFDSRQGQGIFFSIPQRPGRLWGPPDLLFSA
jgi:hypothetical protein